MNSVLLNSEIKSRTKIVMKMGAVDWHETAQQVYGCSVEIDLKVVLLNRKTLC